MKNTSKKSKIKISTKANYNSKICKEIKSNSSKDTISISNNVSSKNQTDIMSNKKINISFSKETSHLVAGILKELKAI